MTLVRVKLWIETHLSEGLSAERIAGVCRISARHLNRLFEREGTSPMRYVWDRRLTRCHRDVTDPAMRGRPVGEIAFAAGFNDLSHFSRAYRARYGCAPRVCHSAVTSTDRITIRFSPLLKQWTYWLTHRRSATGQPRPN